MIRGNRTNPKHHLYLLIVTFILLSNIKPAYQTKATPQPNPRGEQEPEEQNQTETDNQPQSVLDQVTIVDLHPKILAIMLVILVILPSIAIYTLRRPKREN